MVSFTWEDLEKAADGTPIAAWDDACEDVSSTRSKVDSYLADGGQAYGFSTLLGHLDSHRLSMRDVQNDMFRAHLVGEPHPVSLRQIRAITAVKLSQLAQAANGVSLEIYSALLKSFTQLERSSALAMDLAASYGSGDVVPAAWWVHSVLGQNPCFDRGDVIALINGNFITPGLVLADYASWRSAIDEVVDTVLIARKTLGGSEVQLPVSLRDVSPLTQLVDFSFSRLRDQVIAAVNEPTGNPLFVESGGEFKAVSNSSFLNFSLASSLSAFAEMLEACSAYLRSATERLANVGEQREGELVHGAYFVQPPKVSKAYFDQIHSLMNTSFPLAQSESHMVEDIGDTALARWRILNPGVELLRTQLGIAQGVLAALNSEPGQPYNFALPT
ncbi:aromatic amino acid ammonia-lyase [Corynebacterium cystitidis]|uniref:aromatic amino acid ammonia-lyase n=1 Tax=Corynebacterium cystitidis TaxID=35757 RepID=UPI00211EF00B|nr:aromatic amino acid ammonia-lyase [Corynebacterium cystitidis]